MGPLYRSSGSRTDGRWTLHGAWRGLRDSSQVERGPRVGGAAKAQRWLGAHDRGDELGASDGHGVHSRLCDIWITTPTVSGVPGPAPSAQFGLVLDTLHDKLPHVAAHLETAHADVLACTALPQEICRQIWSNNPSERLNRNIRRRATWSGSSRPQLPHPTRRARGPPPPLPGRPGPLPRHPRRQGRCHVPVDPRQGCGQRADHPRRLTSGRMTQPTTPRLGT